MRVFGRKPQAEPTPAEVHPASLRKPPRACFACKQVRPPYVYAENGHDYCVECATKSYEMFGLRPAGRRDGDITLEDLLRMAKRRAG